ncbi:glycosyl hydrolases family 31-domain-containing protein [Obelidium mucronatum]|nr:glycosyl hydrolases family 31-domain-containing protein [Obelidium mucronatum]
MREFIPSNFTRRPEEHKGEVLRLHSAEGTVFTVNILDNDTIRIRHFDASAPNKDRWQHTTHSVHGPASTNISGQPRDSIPRLYPCPSAAVTAWEDGTGYNITTQSVTIRVSAPPTGTIALTLAPTSHPTQPFLEDLPHRAYPLLKPDGGARHFIRRRDQDLHYGMGERASPLSLNGRRFRLETMDALGYNPELTDPLYKLVPFHITLDTVTRIAHGIFYDSFAEGFADFGQEIDAFWGPYRSHTLLSGCGLDMYIFYGPTIENVIERYTGLVGRPAMPPKYALGYLASAMGYAESENAQELIAELPRLCRKWNIPCDLLHLSSGYTVDESTGARNVFTWNKKRFPDPEKLIKDLRKEGIRISANVKPWLLSQHPKYQQVYDADGFIKNSETNLPRSTRLWSAGNGATSTGSYFDLSSAAGRKFWQEGVKSLLAAGIESIWNDNNEFSLPDNNDTYAHTNLNGGSSTVGHAGRGLQTLLMASASHEAMVSMFPKRRPFLISRSAVSGVQRFAAQSWSGDNYTSWQTLKHNIPMGLNCGLSGFVGYGHDVGGFVGPRPEKELFVRWVQNGVFHPRFCIHSWKDEGVTEPWMYPEVLPIIRDAIHLRYKLIPYIYTLYNEASVFGHPIIRPLIYEFQHDCAIQQSSFEFMLGPHLLIASVFEQGSRTRSVRLPCLEDPVQNKAAWCDINTGIWYAGGGEKDVEFACPLEQCGVVLAKRGAIVPTGPVYNYVGEEGKDCERVYWLFPPPSPPQSEIGGEDEVWEYVCFEDDGETVDGGVTHIVVSMRLEFGMVVVEVKYGARNDFHVRFEGCRFVLPVGDSRKIRVSTTLFG